MVGVLDKYGPLGVALVVVCVLLWLIVQRVLPAMNETWARQIEAERQVFRDALGLIRDDMASQRDKATQRHEEIIDKLDSIEGKVERVLPPDASTK